MVKVINLEYWEIELISLGVWWMGPGWGVFGVCTGVRVLVVHAGPPEEHDRGCYAGP